MKSFIKISDLFTWEGEINRGPYLLWGIILFFIKYNVDRLISILFTNDSWSFLNYLIDYESHNIFMLSTEEQSFYLILVLVAIPFIWVGTVLTLKRLRHAGLPLVLVLVFFIPFINLLSFVILSIIPGNSAHQTEEERKPAFLSRVIPESKWGNAAFAVLITIIVSLLLTVFSIHLLNDYGWGLFIGIPFVLGFSSSLLYGYHQPRSMKECLSVAFTSLILSSIFIFAFAIEGLICLLMAFPVGLGLSLIGALIGYVIQSRNVKGKGQTWTATVLLIPVLMSFEYLESPEANEYAVTSSVLIDASKEEVWRNVIAFPELPNPEELLFQSGIAYPIYAEIDGKGPGAIRRCVFNTGKFVEPIEKWEENKLLEFSVNQQPHPMIEMTPYKDIHAPHLSGYFASTKGQFLLTEQPDGKILLEGTTWYYNKVWPNIYWKVWSDYIIHQIHLRVLKHIKRESER